MCDVIKTVESSEETGFTTVPLNPNKKTPFLVTLTADNMKRLDALNVFHKFSDAAKKSSMYAILLKEECDRTADIIYHKEMENIELTVSELAFREIYNNI